MAWEFRLRGLSTSCFFVSTLAVSPPLQTMSSVEISAPTPDQMQVGSPNDKPDAPLSFPNPEGSPGEFSSFLRSLSDPDLPLAWDHLNSRPGRSPTSNLFDEQSAQDWMDRMDTFIVSSTFPSQLLFNTVTPCHFRVVLVVLGASSPLTAQYVIASLSNASAEPIAWLRTSRFSVASSPGRQNGLPRRRK